MGRNVLAEITLISEADIRNAITARAGNARAQQNSAAMHKALTSCWTGSLKTNFSHYTNIPAEKDGPLLLKYMANFTTVRTQKSAMNANKELALFDPQKYTFNILAINKALNHLFLRYSQSSFGAHLDNNLRLFYILTAYDLIKRPSEWSYFVERKLQERESNPPTLTDPRVLMIEAATKFNDLKQFTQEYKASKEIQEEYVVAMLAKQDKKLKAQETTSKKTKKELEKDKEKEKGKDDGNKDPPFLLDTKDAQNAGATYKENSAAAVSFKFGVTLFFLHAYQLDFAQSTLECFRKLCHKEKCQQGFMIHAILAFMQGSASKPWLHSVSSKQDNSLKRNNYRSL